MGPYGPMPPSEPCVPVSRHTAQAGCVASRKPRCCGVVADSAHETAGHLGGVAAWCAYVEFFVVEEGELAVRADAVLAARELLPAAGKIGDLALSVLFR